MCWMNLREVLPPPQQAILAAADWGPCPIRASWHCESPADYKRLSSVLTGRAIRWSLIIESPPFGLDAPRPATSRQAQMDRLASMYQEFAEYGRV